MKNKRPYRGELGNVVDSILSDPIKKSKQPDELPSDVDGINRISEEEPPIKKNRKSKRH